MEDRLPVALHLEMSDLATDDYRARRAAHLGTGRAALFENLVRDRGDLPRTHPEFDLLCVVEVEGDAPVPPPDPAVVGSHRFVRTSRPGQGSLTDEGTNGLQLVLISPKDADDAEAAQALRDWADFVHIRHIAEAAVPGFRMITPYVNVDVEGPRFLHLYEMHTDDPEAAFRDMTPRVAERLGGFDSDEYREWAWHPQLRIDYVNTFRRIE